MTALLALMLTLAPADLENADAIRQRAREAVSLDGVQSTFPLSESATQVPLTPAERTTPPPPLDDSALPVIAGGAMSVIGVALGYAMLGVVVAVIVFAVVRVLSGLSWGERRSADHDETGGTSVSGLVAEIERGDEEDFVQLAERLGKEGRYDEATHCLLLGAIDHVTRTSEAKWSDSMTSRELLGGVDLDESRRRAFRVLVFAVERSVFGGRHVEREAFETCREHFRAVLAGATA